MAVYLVPRGDGRPVPVEKSILLFGRHPDCDVVIRHSRKVSRKHCCLAVVNDALFIRDMGSMNGVRVNGQRIRKLSPVVVGDEVAVGDVVYTVSNQKPEKENESPPDNIPRLDRMQPSSEKAAPVVPADLDLSQNVPVVIPEPYSSNGDELAPDDDADDIPLVDLDDD